MARISKWGEKPEPARSFIPETLGAWIYARLSLENSRSEDSIDSQIAFCRDYIESQSDLDYKGFFDDVGHTGTNMNRPRFNEMMAGILDGDIKCVVVKDLSRFGRTYIEVGELLFDTFIQLGVRFISVNDNYDSFAPDAGRKKLLILVKNLRNSQYSKDLGQKIKSAAKMNQQRGKRVSGVPPYGYWFTEDKQGFQIVPEAAEVIRLAFNLYHGGMGTGRVSEYLNANGYMTPHKHYLSLGLLKRESSNTRSKAWTSSNLSGMLKNQTYIGHLVQGKHEKAPDGRSLLVPSDKWIIHPDRYPPIIDKELFEAVQKRLADSREKRSTTVRRREDNIYMGKTYCSRCGYATYRINPVGRDKKTTYPVFRCTRCISELKRTMGCVERKSYALRLADLDAVVYGEITRQIHACIDIDVLLDKAANSPCIAEKRRELMSRRGQLLKDSERAVELITAAYSHHLGGLLNVKEFNAARTKFEQDKQNALTALAKVEDEILAYDAGKARESDYIVQFRKYHGFAKLDKGIIDALIKRIVITPMTNEVSITFNYADSFKRFAGLLEESGVLEDAC